MSETTQLPVSYVRKARIHEHHYVIADIDLQSGLEHRTKTGRSPLDVQWVKFQYGLGPLPTLTGELAGYPVEGPRHRQATKRTFTAADMRYQPEWLTNLCRLHAPASWQGQVIS